MSQKRGAPQWKERFTAAPQGARNVVASFASGLRLKFPAWRLRNIVKSRRGRLMSVAVAFAFFLGILAIQYSKYGMERYLGWDTVNYVYLAKVMEDLGPLKAIQEWNYPHLYVLLLWALGKGVGSFDLVERALPAMWVLVLLTAYESIAWQIQPRWTFSFLTTILAAVSMNTLRIFADLNRTLMAFSLSLLILSILGHHKSRPQASKMALVGVMLFIVAATELETYFLLALAILSVGAMRRDWRFMKLASLLIFSPLLILSPLLAEFLLNYYAQTLALPESAVLLGAEEFIIFLGGSIVVLPVLALGTFSLARLARHGNFAAQAITGWLFGASATFALLLSGIVRLPPVRVLLLVPVPLVLISSILFLNRAKEAPDTDRARF